MDFPCFLHIVINARNLLNFILFKEQLMDKGHLGTIITCYFSQVKAGFYILHFPCAYYWRSLSFHVWICD